jgi:uncharacterized iron-regulated protein
MQKGIARYALLAGVLIAAGALADSGAQPVYDLLAKRKLTLADIAPQLIDKRIVLVGEHHPDASHHRAQLRVIQALAAAGGRVAVGLEMFRKDSQAALDRWSRGEMSTDEFKKVYAENWNYPWEAYEMIFEYARAERLPMIGLNVPPGVTRQVARGGFQSLSAEQRGLLSDVTCSIDEDYMRYIRSAYGAHSHGTVNFTYFCEAQMVWDAAMAARSLDYLESNPEATVVILTGVGHAQKGAVPRQVRLRSAVPATVLLPEVPGSLEAGTVGPEDADYLLLDLE